MAATNLTRSGTFNIAKLPVLEGKLLTAGAPRPFGVYGTDTGLLVNWPNGLSAGQITTFQAVIDTYVEPTDLSYLTQQQINALNFLSNNSPTNAQTLAALKGVIRFLLKYTTGKDSIDGTDVST